MNHNTNKEKWIDDAMGSLQGMRRAAPPADLFEQVTLRLNQQLSAKVAPAYAKQWTAAAILLLALNVSSVLFFEKKHNHRSAVGSSNPFAMEIQSETTYNY